MTWDAGPNWTHRLARHLAVILQGRCRFCIPDVARLNDAADRRVSDAAVLEPLAKQAFLAADPLIHTVLGEDSYHEFEEIVRRVLNKSKAVSDFAQLAAA
ncbi:hypothetical protein [Zavarzinella formosa]|uniref:hypothetical protein n=1 Tax=Zavarzinella formosa TaxID=360055 RepID=UPI0002F8ED87|nr:hypothetical protein [Zavarzinella formosa]